ncbi:DUF1998 domain-containing protein [Tsukamurella tyrosinosolvens]|uniref:DUF1998 domain-containing protein n=1 Tax=Tsukamurella tyrosinosolvens TaxID=57704 RepID=UPI0009EE8580|nr:DUF1998 domain-containing protein [Tsukamurella tyrosinosolvens]
MVSKKLKTTKSISPIGSVRRSQLITTYGVGSVIPLDSESFIVVGLDSWYPRAEDVIDEPRLCHALGVSQLFSPPAGEHGGRVPLARFPEWVHCPNCHRLDKFWMLAAKRDDKRINLCRYCATSTLIPSRFVSCCAIGHIQDFPYLRWVHDGRVPDGDHTLKLRTNPKDSSLAGLTVSCSCGSRRTMEGALGGANGSDRCQGRSPWLDREYEPCSEPAVGLQRGASNVWFADVRSALTIDRSESPAEAKVRELMPAISAMELAAAEDFLRSCAPTFGFAPDEFIAAYRARVAPGTVTFEDLRRDEYFALGRFHEEAVGRSFACTPTPIDEASAIGTLVTSVSRVSRLREVRALRGFNRVRPTDVSPAGALTRSRTMWMPAIEVLGEGIFLQLDDDVVEEWTRTDFAVDRAATLTDAIRRAGGSADAPAVGPRRLLLHSLAHALLNELALTSGYPASSIRERVYDAEGQAGILLYTATADAAGSLGGLCAHGDVDIMSRVFMAAAERAQWCSADPVCLESTSTGAGAVNLAACHSCLLVPEVSCEHQNRYLDRAALVGTVDNPSAGFLMRLNGAD